MSKLNKEIERLTKSMRNERKAGVEENKLAFYGNVVQIEFNTWHFVDANSMGVLLIISF